MSAIVGERDKLLQAAVPRNLTPRQGKDLSLQTDASSFHVAVDGSPAPAFIEFTAHKIDLAGVDTWVASNGATLTGSGLTRRLYYANMPGVTTTVTLTTVEDGEIYVAKASASKVKDGATGEDGDPADVTPEALLTALEGRITKSQLFADLKSEINLITDPVSTPGSVQARVKAETDARVVAIGDEVQARIAADLAEAGARSTFVQNYTFSKAETNQALSIQASTIAAAYTTYTDHKTAQAVIDATSLIQNYSYSKAAADAAEAAQSATLTTNYTAYADAARSAAVSTSSADVRNYSYAKSATDSAIAAAESRLRSEFVSSGGATEGFVTNYAYSKSQIDQSEALQSSTLSANFQATANAARDQAVSTSAADVRNYSYAKTTIDQAFSSQSNTITAAYTSYANAGDAAAVAAAAADIRNYSYSKATVDTAIAQSTVQLTSTVGGHTATLETQTTSINGLSTQITIKSDINGYITGYGLASASYNGAPSSIFIINAGAFSVVAPGAAPKTMFTVGLVNGVAQMVLRGDALFDGAITARALKIGSFDNVIPDPKFNDLGWWGRPGYPVGDYTGQNNGWLGGAIMLIQPYDGNTRSTTSKAFATTPGAVMRLEVQVELSADLEGEFSVFFYVEGASLYSMGCPNVGTWSTGSYPGWPVQFNSQSTKGRFSFSQTITIPLNSQCANAHMVVVDRLGAGSVAFGSCSATRVSDTTLIDNEGVTTPKLAALAVVAEKIATDAVQARHVASDTMEARHLKSDVIQARHMTANSIVTDSIIANGISSIDRVFTTSYTFTSVRDFKLDLTVTQEGAYNAESGTTSGGWILELYVDQGAGLGYWQTKAETFRGGLYSDTLELGATSVTYPYYRISAKSGTGPFLAVIWKVFK